MLCYLVLRMTEVESNRHSTSRKLINFRSFYQVLIPARIGNSISIVSPTECGDPVVVLNLLTNEVTVQDSSSDTRRSVMWHLPQCCAAKGGLLCDEPGLGKSVSLLAVILKSLGNMTTGQPDNGKI